MTEPNKYFYVWDLESKITGGKPGFVDGEIELISRPIVGEKVKIHVAESRYIFPGDYSLWIWSIEHKEDGVFLYLQNSKPAEKGTKIRNRTFVLLCLVLVSALGGVLVQGLTGFESNIVNAPAAIPIFALLLIIFVIVLLVLALARDDITGD
jgi:hypothetical protein